MNKNVEEKTSRNEKQTKKNEGISRNTNKRWRAEIREKKKRITNSATMNQPNLQPNEGNITNVSRKKKK